MKTELHNYLYQAIPITKSLGLRVLDAGRRVRLGAPLGPNINHKQTVFGGSLYSVAVLAGWSWVWMRLQEEKLEAHIVISGSEMDYQNPVTSDFTATCEGIDAEAWDRALTIFERHGKARVTLPVLVEAGGEEKALLLGDFAIIR